MSTDREISELVKSTIQTKIIEAFKSTPQMIDDLVSACLSREVNEYGSKPDYHSRSKMPYLEYLARSTVEGIAREAVRQYFQDTQGEVISQMVKEKLSKGEWLDEFTKAISGVVKEDYKIDVHFKRENDR